MDTRGVDNQVETQVIIVEPFSVDIHIREVSDLGANLWETLRSSIMKESEDKFENNWNLIAGRNYHLRAYVNDVSGNKI